MTVSRSERAHDRRVGRCLGRVAAVVPLALIVGFASPLKAQESTSSPSTPAQQPLRLVPPKAEPSDNAQPTDAQGAAPADSATAPSLRPSPGQVPESVTGGGVQVDQLGAVDQGSVGVLTPSDGGFPVDMWHGTDLESAKRLIAELPVDTESPAMRDIMRRLLLSRAATPAGGKGNGNGTDLVVLRARVLLAMGEANAALQLIDAVPHPRRGILFERVAAEAHLVTGDYIAACRPAADGAKDGSDSNFWDKLLIFCQAVAKQNSKAELGLAVQREAGGADPAYFTLINAIINGTPVTSLKIDAPTPMLVAAAAASGSKLDDGVLATAGMPVVTALALSDKVVSPEVRVEAAERAAAAGAIDSERLRDAYKKVEFSKKDRDNALSRADALPGPQARALLYQAASGETVPSARAETLGKAVEIADKTGRPTAMALAIAPLFRQLSISSDLLWLAPQTVRTMLRVGDDRAAMSWFGLVRSAAKNNADAAKALAELAPLVEVAAPDSPIGGTAALGAWWDVHRGDEAKHPQAAVLGGILGALGTAIPSGFWAEVGDPPRDILRGSAAGGDPVAQVRLQSMLVARQGAPAASDGTVMVSSASEVTRVAGPSRQAETAALAVETLGAPGPAARPVPVSQEVVAALKAAGLGQSARRLALEVLMTHGL